MNKILLVLSGVLALAQYVQAEAPELTGDVQIEVTVNDVVNVSAGENSVALTIVGSFIEGSADSFSATVSAGSLVNVAVGDGSCSQVVLGSVTGTLACGSVSSDDGGL